MRCLVRLVLCGVVLAMLGLPATAGAQDPPWSDPSLGPDRRAELVIAAMTLTEKAELMSNDTGTSWAYYNAGIERLGSRRCACSTRAAACASAA